MLSYQIANHKLAHVAEALVMAFNLHQLRFGNVVMSVCVEVCSMCLHRAHILIEIGGLLDKRCVTRGHDWKPGLERQYIGTLVPYAKVMASSIVCQWASYTLFFSISAHSVRLNCSVRLLHYG